MIPSPSDTGSREHSDPMDVDAVKFSLVWQRKRVTESARWVLSAVEYISQRDRNARKNTGKQSSGKGQTEQVMVQE